MADEKFLSHFDVSASALTAERLQMRLIANNMANINTTRTADGGPYKRMEALVEGRRLNNSQFDQGVAVKKIIIDQSEPRLVYNPGHPDANAQGYVAYPNLDLVSETARLKQSSLAYEANATVFETIKKSISSAIDISN